MVTLIAKRTSPPGEWDLSVRAQRLMVRRTDIQRISSQVSESSQRWTEIYVSSEVVDDIYAITATPEALCAQLSCVGVH